MKKHVITSIWLFFSSLIFAQDKFVAKLVFNSESSDKRTVNSNFESVFSKYAVYQLETAEIENYLNLSNRSTKILNLQFGDKNWLLNLKPHDIRAKHYTYQENTGSGIIIHPKTPSFTYRGYSSENEKDKAVLAIRNGCFSGYVQDNGTYFYIESARAFDPTSSKNYFVFYNAKDLRENVLGLCTQNRQDISSEPLIHSINAAVRVNQCTEMAVAFDQSFKNKMGGKDNAESAIMARLNLVSDHYEKEFGIEYKLVTIYECAANEFTPDSNTESCKEGGGTCQNGTVLKEFANWGNSPDGFGGVLRDVATFWTGRNLKDGSNTGNIGYSFFAGICNNKGYNIVEDYFSTGNNAHASIWIHELGHTWNAYHTANNKTNMMSPNIYGNTGSEPTNRFVTSGTRTSINNHRDSRTCLDEGCESVGIDVLEMAKVNLNAYPNPFNAGVNITFNIESSQEVVVEIYDALGVLVYENQLGKQAAGTHTLFWGGHIPHSISTGIYFLNLKVGSQQTEKLRLVMLK